LVVAEDQALLKRMKTSEKKGFDDLTIIAGGSLLWRLGVEGCDGGTEDFKGLVGVLGPLSSAANTLVSLVSR
jgi:hypothetical protein